MSSQWDDMPIQTLTCEKAAWDKGRQCKTFNKKAQVIHRKIKSTRTPEQGNFYIDLQTLKTTLFERQKT